MSKLTWYKNRLKAMSREEVLWRLDQKKIQRVEKKNFDGANIPVTKECFYGEMRSALSKYEGNRLPLGRFLKMQTALTDVKELLVADYNLVTLGGLDYKENKTSWKAGIQTENEWPDIFSYKLDYKGKDEIGDARSNWELNRHYQFAALACRFLGTGKKKYITELGELFHDWNEKNPFLTGIAWVSVMEVAIRAINWMVTLGFLEKCKEKSKFKKEILLLEEELSIGIVNMICYCQGHYSRFSSANNHTLVEAAAIGIAGTFYDEENWKRQARAIISEELEKQIYSDGVGKECSLHYQAFGMEAIGLLCYVMDYNKEKIPQAWKQNLNRQLKFLTMCCGGNGEIVVFGDEDEGKIIDLVGDVVLKKASSEGAKEAGETKETRVNIVGRNYYNYVIRLLSDVLSSRIESVTEKDKPELACYKQGGISLLRDFDRKILIGFDHGELGYGTIAAHGHADALSVRVFYKGKGLFTGPGTYLYHCDKVHRDLFRSTKAHNTISINDRDQSEMLGAFLWGKRAQCTFIGSEENKPYIEENGEKKLVLDEYGQKISEVAVEASEDGYAPIIHRRRVALFERQNVPALERLAAMPAGKSMAGVRPDCVELEITDFVETIEGCDIILHYNIGNDWKIVENQGDPYSFVLKSEGDRLKLNFEIPDRMTDVSCSVEEVPFAPVYGQLSTQKQIVIKGNAKETVNLVTRIKFPDKKSIH